MKTVTTNPGKSVTYSTDKGRVAKRHKKLGIAREIDREFNPRYCADCPIKPNYHGYTVLLLTLVLLALLAVIGRIYGQR